MLLVCEVVMEYRIGRVLLIAALPLVVVAIGDLILQSSNFIWGDSAAALLAFCGPIGSAAGSGHWIFL